MIFLGMFFKVFLKTNSEHAHCIVVQIIQRQTQWCTKLTVFYSEHSGKLKLSISDNTDDNKMTYIN